jgi:hypothetical protein
LTRYLLGQLSEEECAEIEQLCLENDELFEELEVLLRMAALEGRAGCEITVRVVAGPVKQALIDAARESAADVSSSEGFWCKRDPGVGDDG